MAKTALLVCYFHDCSCLCKLLHTLAKIGFVGVVSWSAQNCTLLTHCTHVRITLTVEHISFDIFYKRGWEGDCRLFKLLKVTKALNIFLTHFRFFKKAKKLFNVTGQHICSSIPTKISAGVLLPGAKHSFQKRV